MEGSSTIAESFRHKMWSEYVCQISNVIENLIFRNDLKVLEATLHSLKPCNDLNNIESVQAEFAIIVFHKESYDQLTEILQSVNFHPRWHPKLQRLWYEMQYRIAERKQGKPIGAVTKYRLRKKFPLPRTIWDGENMNHNIKDSSRNLLNESYKMSKYPTCYQKRELSLRTGLSINQITNWFKNKRARIKKRTLQEQAKREELAIQQVANLGNQEYKLHEQQLTNDRRRTFAENEKKVALEKDVVDEKIEIFGDKLITGDRDIFGGELKNPETAVFAEMKKFDKESNIKQKERVNEATKIDLKQRTTSDDPAQPPEMLYQNEICKEIKACSPYQYSSKPMNNVSKPKIMEENGIETKGCSPYQNDITPVNEIPMQASTSTEMRPRSNSKVTSFQPPSLDEYILMPPEYYEYQM